MKTVIEAINTPSTYQFSGDTAELRLYATLPFVTSDGQLIGQGEPILNNSWYLPITCEVQPTNILYVPSFEVDSTTDGQPRTSKYIATLFTEDGAYIGPMPTTNPSGFVIPPPTVMPNPTWGQLAIYNGLPTLLYPPTTFPTSTEMYAAIAAAIGQQQNASETNKGVTALTTDPFDPTFPIAVSASDPEWLALIAGGGGSGFTAENGFYNITNPDYGFNLDGSTDDTAAFQALIDDVVPDGAIIFIPPSRADGSSIDMVIDGEVLIEARNNIRITSFNDYKFASNGPILRRAGNAGGIMLNFQACFGCTVDGLRFTLDGDVVQFGCFDGDPQPGHISSQNNLYNCTFQFSNAAIFSEDWIAWGFSQSSAQNNELMTIENCSVFGSGAATKYNDGSISASDNTLTIASATLTNGNVGDRVRVGLAGVGGRDLVTTIASVTNPTTCELTDAATGTVTNSRTFVGQSYGTGFVIGNSQNALHYRFVNLNLINLGIGVDINEGSGRIELISGGVNDIDVRIRRNLAEGWIIQGLDTENTMQTLFVDAGDQLSPLHIYKCRGANDKQVSDGWMVLAGQVTLSQSAFRVAPPLGGKLLRDNGNTCNLLSVGNIYVQSNEVGDGGIINSGLSSMRAYTTIGDQNLVDLGVNGPGSPFVQFPSEVGPFNAHSVFDKGGFGIPGLGSVNAAGFLSNSSRYLEAATQTGSQVIADGALEVYGSFRPAIPIVLKYGTHGGAAAYKFSFVAKNSDGAKSMRSYAGEVAAAANTLSGTNFLRVMIPSIAQASTYELYLQNPSNSSEGYLLATGIVNNHPDPSYYDVVANPAPAYVAWSTLLNTFPEANGVSIKSRVNKPIELTFVDADTSPRVSGADRFAEANTNPTSITAFDNGIEGQQIRIRFTTGNTTIVQGGSMKLAGGVDFVGTASDMITLERVGSTWVEISRSVNA